LVGVRRHVESELQGDLGVRAEEAASITVESSARHELGGAGQMPDRDLVADPLGIADAELPSDAPGSGVDRTMPRNQLELQSRAQAVIDVSIVLTVPLTMRTDPTAVPAIGRAAHG
jgi:hypothetical protein